MDLPLEWLPASGQPEQLMLLLHGVGSHGADLAPLAQLLRAEFPQAAILAPDAPHAHATGGPARQWFSIDGITEDNRVGRVAQALETLRPWIRQTQSRLGLPPATTALVGFSQGAILSMEAAVRDDGLAGRVLAFSGRFARLPDRAPKQTTLHLFHGGVDAVIPVAHARAAFEHLGALQGDATIDIAEGIGHVLHPVLTQRAIFRLRNHIPLRTWQAALGSVPAIPSVDADGNPQMPDRQ